MFRILLIDIARAFACLLLDCAYRGSATLQDSAQKLLLSKKFPSDFSLGGVRVLKVVVKAAKECLGDKLEVHL